MKRIKLKMLGVIIALVMVMGVILSGLNVSEAGSISSGKKSYNPYLTQEIFADISAGWTWDDKVGSSELGRLVYNNYINYNEIKDKYDYIQFFTDSDGDGFLSDGDTNEVNGLALISIQTSYLLQQIFLGAAGYETAGQDSLADSFTQYVGDENATITLEFCLNYNSTGSFSGKKGDVYSSTYSNGTWDMANMPSEYICSDEHMNAGYPYIAEFLGLDSFDYLSSDDSGFLSNLQKYWNSFEYIYIYVTTSEGDIYYLVGVYDPDSIIGEDTYASGAAQSESIQYMLVSEEAFDDYEFSTELEYDANYLDGTNAGGTLTDGTYYPNQKKVDDISITYPTVDDGSYYAELQEKYESLEPTVTATITSETDEGIVSTNGVAMNTDGTVNSEGWYYPDTTDTTVIAKDYLFATYNNDEDNGIVNEKVALVGENGGEDEQTVSITWPFRIIDEIYKENDDGSTTVTIVTNLPMDPDQIEDGWKYVDGSDYHEIRKTYAAGEDVDEDVTVYQNETGETDETTVQIDAEEEKKDEADEDFPKTGEPVTIGVLLVIAIALGVVIYRKKKNIYNK